MPKPSFFASDLKELKRACCGTEMAIYEASPALVYKEHIGDLLYIPDCGWDFWWEGSNKHNLQFKTDDELTRFLKLD